MTPFSDIVPYIYDELEKSELFEDDYLDTELKLFKISRMILVSATVDFASCEKLKDNIEYTATKIFTFGQAGTNGTDCTLVIDLIKDTTSGKPCIALLSGKRNGYIFRA